MKTDGTQLIGFGQLNLETGTIINQGLSKREYFAAKSLQGYISADFTANSGIPHNELAKWAVDMADALINELNK